HHVADHASGHFALTHGLESMPDALDAFLDVLALDRPFLQGPQHAAAQLPFVERLASIVALDDMRHHQLRRLEGREALAARLAFATSANLTTFPGQTRVDDLGVLVTAKGTMHGAPPGWLLSVNGEPATQIQHATPH